MVKYNIGVYMPSEIQLKIRAALKIRYEILPTKHYYNKATLCHVDWGAYKAALCGQVVECEIENEQITKLITRLHNRYKPFKDICFAVALNGKQAIVKTVWVNDRTDTHGTIKIENYVTEEN